MQTSTYIPPGKIILYPRTSIYDRVVLFPLT